MKMAGFIILAFSIAIIAFPAISWSAKEPDNCVCKVQAKVISYAEQPIDRDEDSSQDLTSVSMDIEIINVGEMVSAGRTSDATCEESYKVGDIIKVHPIRKRFSEGPGCLRRLANSGKYPAIWIFP